MRVDLVICRTLVRRPCNVSHVQYATPRCVALSVRLYYTQCHRRRSLPRHQLFIDCQCCPIHTSSVQLHIIIHVVQLKLHSYNYNHDNVIRSVTHNIIPVYRNLNINVTPYHVSLLIISFQYISLLLYVKNTTITSTINQTNVTHAKTLGNHLTVIWLSLDRDKPLV